MRKTLLSCLALVASGWIACAAVAGPMGESLDRGVIAMKTSSGVFVSWRSLTNDAKDLTFDVYRNGVKVNTTPITAGTNITDPAGTTSSTYIIVASDGTESKLTSVESDVYKRLHLDRPAAAKTPSGDTYTYTPNDCSVGDVDGDGEYEIFVKWDPSNSRDNETKGYTGKVFIDCYKLDGTKLWRIDLGPNIRAGAHYTQFMVYDFDQDGKAEMMVKTAPGTIDGQGKAVLMGTDKVTDNYVSSSGTILSGPEYLTVFNGLTGAEINTIAYNPPRTVHAQSNSGWGDNYGNRSERYLACVAYLDGADKNPSAVFCRGYYTHAYLWAVDFDGTQLKEHWLHKSTTKGQGCYGEGAHSLTVGDVDGDGCDEIVFGSASVDHDSKLLYRTGFGHGDALHLGDFDPDREGLEIFMVHEEKTTAYDSELRDARTGEVIWSAKQSGNDIGRGLIADISPTWRGHEFWPQSYYGENGSGAKANATFDCKGNYLLEKRPDCNFRIYWDGDLLDELFDGKYDSSTKVDAPHIVKRNAAMTSNANEWTFAQYNGKSCNTTKSTPCLQADIYGDWREELILWDGSNSSDLLIFSTTIESKYRVPTLMEDHNYRLAIAWQNCGYNQPPHLGYYLPDRFATEPLLKLESGRLDMSLEEGYEIEPITGSWLRADDVTATGLPAGVTLTTDPANATFTIEGTPEKAGIYKYTIKSVGGDGTTTLTGTITVTEKVDLNRVAYFTFDEINGSTITNMVYGSADIVGSPTIVDGKMNGALSLNGSDYLTQKAYDDLQMGSKDFTIEMLLKSTDDAAYIFHKGSTTSADAPGATGNWIGLEYKSGNLKFAIDDDKTKSEAAASASTYFNGEWHHIVLVRESATKSLKMYVDGQLIAQNTDNTGAINDNNELLVIGNANNSFNNAFKGCLDDLSIYHGAMSAQKVAERFAGYKQSGIEEIEFGLGEGPVRLTLVDAGTGMTVATGWGAEENVTSNAAPGVYILLTEQGRVRNVKKIVL